MKKTLLFFCVMATLVLSSCAKIYSTPDALVRAKTHKLIAIVPPVVAIAAKKGVDVNVMKEQQRTESLSFQKEMISWLLKRKMQGRIVSNLTIQDVETTNAKLQNAGLSETKLFTPEEMCEILGVDAILNSNFTLSKPMSEGAAVVLGLLVGVWGSTNQATTNFSLHDKETKQMIWSFQHTISGSLFSSPAQLINELMRQSSRKMPYYINPDSKIRR
jgi:hypothetical protein